MLRILIRRVSLDEGSVKKSDIKGEKTMKKMKIVDYVEKKKIKKILEEHPNSTIRPCGVIASPLGPIIPIMITWDDQESTLLSEKEEMMKLQTLRHILMDVISKLIEANDNLKSILPKETEDEWSDPCPTLQSDDS